MNRADWVLAINNTNRMVLGKGDQKIISTMVKSESAQEEDYQSSNLYI
jgi:hypothetical protein